MLNSHPKKSMLGPTGVGTYLEWPHLQATWTFIKISNIVIMFVHLVKLWELWYVKFGKIAVLYWYRGCNLGI
jgi:hypothetical protein